MKRVTCNIIRQGNSASITIPTAIMEQYGWDIGDIVKVPFHEFKLAGTREEIEGRIVDKKGIKRYIGTIGKQKIEISEANVEEFCDRIVEQGKTIRNVRKYYVNHNGKEIPPKVIISGVTGIPSGSFNAIQAKYILERLGFEVSEKY